MSKGKSCFGILDIMVIGMTISMAGITFSQGRIFATGLLLSNTLIYVYSGYKCLKLKRGKRRE